MHPEGPTDVPEISIEGDAEEQQLVDVTTGTDLLTSPSRGMQQGAVSQEGAAGITEEPDRSVGAAPEEPDKSVGAAEQPDKSVGTEAPDISTEQPDRSVGIEEPDISAVMQQVVVSTTGTSPPEQSEMTLGTLSCFFPCFCCLCFGMAGILYYSQTQIFRLREIFRLRDLFQCIYPSWFWKSIEFAGGYCCIGSHVRNTQHISHSNFR